MIISLAAFCILSTSGTAQAETSEEEAMRIAQSSRYNRITGNWEVEVTHSSKRIADSFKSQMPALEYHLVEEGTAGKDSRRRTVLTFRGKGDQRVVIKLMEGEQNTKLRIRFGLTGNQTKSSDLFKYVYQRI